MPNAIYCILRALSELGGAADVYDVGASSGYEYITIYAYTQPARRRGWIDKRANLFLITERGKIAAAIETGRRTRAAANGLTYQPQTLTKFMKDN